METNYTLSEIADRISAQSDEDLTEEQLIKVIQKVVSFHKNKTFAYYESDDIASEIWIICLKQLQHYEAARGRGHDLFNSLERWLNKVVHNRLANLYRDRYSSVNEDFRKARMNIMNSLSIDAVDTSKESIRKWAYSEDLNFQLIYEEFIDFIETRLPSDLINIYYDCIYEENVTPYYKSKLKNALIPILEEWRKLHIEENG